MNENRNRQYRDSVFVDLFCDDIHGRENFLSLYNAIHDTDLTLDDVEVEPMRLEKVLYHKFYNDVSMRVGNRIIVLCEHQSTVNYNMPLRCLIYVARLYEKMTDPKMRFARLQQQIAFPEFYVFYNGSEQIADEMTLKLSDAFDVKGGGLSQFGIDESDLPLELKVKVYNINSAAVIEKLAKCETLRQYTQFISLVQKHRQSGDEEYLKQAIREAIKSGVLAEYLNRKATEVENMIFAEYDYDTDIAVQKEEAMQKGREEGHKEGWLEGSREVLKYLQEGHSLEETMQHFAKP